MSRMENRKYKIIFCDIDGTLLDSNHLISENTKTEIRKLERMGIPFVLVSARMPSGVFSIQKELGIKAPIVCYNGGLVFDENAIPLQSIGIDRDSALAIHDDIRKTWKTVCCSTYHNNDWIAEDTNDPWIVQEYKITSSEPKRGKIMDFVPPDGQVHKFLCMGDAEQIAQMNEVLKERYPALSIYRSKHTYLEIMDGTVLKSSAVKTLCREYDIPIKASVSFGDNFNDVDMLLATGIGFAMANAPEEVRRQIRNVTLSNDQEGVLAGLRQLNF